MMMTLEQIEAVRVIGSAVNHILRDASFSVDDDGEMFLTERDRRTLFILKYAAMQVIGLPGD